MGIIPKQIVDFERPESQERDPDRWLLWRTSPSIFGSGSYKATLLNTNPSEIGENLQ